MIAKKSRFSDKPSVPEVSKPTSIQQDLSEPKK